MDSHWNNLGASLAYMEIMDKAGINATDYRNIPYSEALDFNGDLYDMLFPEGRKKEKQGVLFYTGIHSATHFINSFRMTSKM